ncbi:echinoidin [Strongylocentrotus purpuratus]|uniref:C-type lectin domain-containing protein n=1 Tax=Strongylocentrotus purpuratus TaxID=7668 RepID=A0A7M7GG48_STRPU|nr:echinoidin [Strongylocentrotus purpuratus]|eukprot:XP_003726792.1 PREDICTED: echinoidin-like [Strongylocentrotus purpuratus]
MTFNVTISLFLISAIACLTEGCCPDMFVGVGDRCYHYSSYKRTWINADSACRGLGAHLVSFHNSGESAEVYDLWKSYTDVAYTDDKDRAYWIGFNDRSYEGSFKWSDGTSVNYVHWQSGAPNDNRGEDCVSPRNSGSSDVTREEWNDYDCNEEKSYFCYVPLTI